MSQIPGTAVVDDAGNELSFQPNGFGSFNVLLKSGGVERATPVRFKSASGKLAADFPGCDSNFVVVDANGSITNG